MVFILRTVASREAIVRIHERAIWNDIEAAAEIILGEAIPLVDLAMTIYFAQNMAGENAMRQISADAPAPEKEFSRSELIAKANAQSDPVLERVREKLITGGEFAVFWRITALGLKPDETSMTLTFGQNRGHVTYRNVFSQRKATLEIKLDGIDQTVDVPIGSTLFLFFSELCTGQSPDIIENFAMNYPGKFNAMDHLKGERNYDDPNEFPYYSGLSSLGYNQRDKHIDKYLCALALAYQLDSTLIPTWVTTLTRILVLHPREQVRETAAQLLAARQFQAESDVYQRTYDQIMYAENLHDFRAYLPCKVDDLLTNTRGTLKDLLQFRANPGDFAQKSAWVLSELLSVRWKIAHHKELLNIELDYLRLKILSLRHRVDPQYFSTVDHYINHDHGGYLCVGYVFERLKEAMANCWKSAGQDFSEAYARRDGRSKPQTDAAALAWIYQDSAMHIPTELAPLLMELEKADTLDAVSKLFRRIYPFIHTDLPANRTPENATLRHKIFNRRNLIERGITIIERFGRRGGG